ncbi:MAG: molecular chaperone HtpG [Clostridiales bacterium]|nr:molecular chaperone HtpG [Clostridiales bacterium]
MEVDILATKRKKQFKTESKRLLELMINSIYTHKEIFLREIISNASDAIDKLCYLALTEDKVGMNRSDFEIKITVDKQARTITVSDNGIGMTPEELEKNLGVIANSGSLKFKNETDEEKRAEEDINIIGQFGVGFYSAFMVSDKVEVVSKAYGHDQAAVWSSSGIDGYTVTPCEKETVGTDIIMHIKPDTEDENYSEFLETYRLRQLIKKYSDYIRYPIKMEIEKSRAVETEETDKDGNKKTKYETYTEEETINSMIPIWQRSKSEVSDEECAKFYKDTYYDTEDPVRIIRISAEGLVSYKAILFIPKKAPYNYYTKDYEAGLQLYASGVLIMERCTDLLPECFRFVRGIVDSQDLSLNISREMLQHDRQLKVIARNLEKRVKSELKKLMTEDPELYGEFFKNFGLQLKYGILGDYGMKRELLQDLLIFYSSNDKKAIPLSEYVSNMPEDQKYIYFACGDSISRLDNLPQAEPVREKGYSILYLTDEPDEFVVNMLGTFEEKPFKSVNADDLGIEDQESRDGLKKQEKEHKKLLDFVKDSLGGSVAAVKLSNKLKSHPVCLTTQGAISLEMEKYFNSLPGDANEKLKAERVLELNADHRTFDALKNAWETDKDKASKYAKLLYFQSLLIAGMEIPDPAEYAKLVNDLIV